MDSAGGRIAAQSFVGPTGGGLLRGETPSGAASRMPPLGNPMGKVPVANPSPTVPSPATTMPAAVNAVSTLLAAGAAPLSSLGSVAQGASAGGGAGPSLASSLAGDQDEGERDELADQQPGERLL